MALQEACLRIGYCHTSHWLSLGLAWPEILGTHEGERRMGPGFPKDRRIRLMPLGQGSLGYQAWEGRGQEPARSFPEADSSILSSCFGSLHNKGGAFTLLDLFTLRHS